ncbi:hypothetical protein Ssed_2383 [Shewanella sediminis HAW-EB3]|uniref:Glycosyltransferase RgtA/B/C/D-like domain-containing protein n=1 Tax=Shewanella sediminis (strain HAW-EB3) TaxID=425104 RepID=A8FVW9_SHESH|nr:hypothetical protein [Shewanella sediminis]ABV36992.1 hypothetical protein Ssed_2383 [Shewanella sediminis HAW-EB3]
MLQHLYRFALLLLKYVLPLVCIVQFLMITILLPLNGDIGWLFHATQEWLQGKRLYIDIIEVNPPMVFLVMAPAVLLSKGLGLSAALTTKVYLVAISAAATFLYLRIMRKILPQTIFSYVFISASIIIIFVMPEYDFGQRDYLAIVFLLPYLISRFHESHGGGQLTGGKFYEAVIIGFIGGIGVCFKPYFIIFPVVGELWLFMQCNRRFATVPVQMASMFAVIGAFCCSVLLFFPSYLTKIIPLGIATYWTYGHPLKDFNLPYFLILLLGLVFATYHINIEIHRRLTQYVSVLTFSALISFLVQSHYSYQLIPFKVLLFINFVLVISLFLIERPQLKSFSSVTGSLMAVWIVFVTGGLIYRKADVAQYVITKSELPSFNILGYSYLSDAVDVINENFAGQPIYVFSTNVWPSSFITTYTKSHWVSAFPALWPLPAIEFYESHSYMLQEKKRMQILAVKTDVINRLTMELSLNKPVAIIVDTSISPSYFPAGFRYSDFIVRNDELETLFRNYKLSTLKLKFFENKTYDVYVINEYHI